MKNVLIFAALAGIASAIAIYFVNESQKDELDYVGDAAEDAYDTMNDNINKAETKVGSAFS
jgi:hypothetical protein